MGTVETIAAEIRSLRKGRGVAAPDLDQRLGPNLRTLVVGASGNDAAKRRNALAAELSSWATTLAADLRMSVMASLALSVDTRHMRHLKDRVSWLAGRLGVDYRTALRRIDVAERLLAEAISLELRRRHRLGTPTSSDWQLEELRTLLRLDTPTPESHEQRRIVANRDGLREVTVALDVPTRRDQPQPALAVEILYGGRLVQREQPGRYRFQFRVELPHSLSVGASHTFGLLLRIPDEQPMRPHYIFTPERPCQTFVLRVRFDLARLPAWVRLVDAETVRTFDDPRPGVEALTLDGLGEVEVNFRNPALYLGYGVQWQW